MLVQGTIQALGKHEEFFERAAAFPGRARERILALAEADELYFRLYPYYYRALQVVRVATQLHAPFRRRREVLQKCENHAIELMTRIVRDGVRAGDLALSGDEPARLAFSMWAFVFGTRALMNTALATRRLGITDGYAVARETAGLLFDGIGWRPFSTEWDYEATRRRIRQEVFATEWNQIQAA